MKQIMNWFARQKQRSKEQRRKEIADTFQIKECGETLCIMHERDAILDFAPNTTIGEVMDKLWEHRHTALKYSKI